MVINTTFTLNTLTVNDLIREAINKEYGVWVSDQDISFLIKTTNIFGKPKTIESSFITVKIEKKGVV